MLFYTVEEGGKGKEKKKKKKNVTPNFPCKWRKQEVR